MPAIMSKLASLALGLATVAAIASGANCPTDLLPYSAEENPFGWPLTPSDFDHSRPECWAEKYPRCTGSEQSPMNLDLLNPDISCQVKSGEIRGLLAARAKYNVVSGEVVSISKYMRAAGVRGDLGTITLDNEAGEKVVYQATGAYLTAGSLHKVNGQAAAAELLIVHRPQYATEEWAGSVVLSLLFKEGAESRLFTQMGFPAGDKVAAEGDRWISPESIGIPQVLESALRGTFYSYSGSVPAPPCTENVQYVVLQEQQTVSASQIEKLREVLKLQAGGTVKREPVARQLPGDSCREISVDSVVVPNHAFEVPCPEATNFTASCWSDCKMSPVAIKTSAASKSTGSARNATDIVAFQPTDHVTVAPSMYTLDASGDFGGVMVQGRLFEARKLSVKAIAQHPINGVRYPGELVIHSTLYGDRFSSGAPVAHRRRLEEEQQSHTYEVAPAVDDAHSPAAAQDDAHSPATAHDEEHSPATAHDEEHSPATDHDEEHSSEADHIDHAEAASHVETQHEVAISIPLKIGRENALLRDLGLGEPSIQAAIRDGNSYAVHGTVDLAAAVASSISKNYYWYSGGPTTPGECPAWGVRWMVFEEPLEVSLEQLNALQLRVSGMDSTRQPQAPRPLSKNFVPKGAVEDDGWTSPEALCDSGKRQSPIDVISANVSTVGTHNFLAKASWKPVSGLRLMATDEGLHFESNQMGYFTLTGQDGFPKYYQVVSVDLKMPSEHMVDGRQFPAELQVTHYNQETVLDYSEDDALIASFLFDFGDESKLLKQMLPAQMPHHGSYTTMAQPVDLMWALGPAMDGTYFNYRGSFTAGRCAEAVQWIVFNHTMTLSIEQWQAFKSSFPGLRSNRPLQPLNGRRLMQNMMVEGTPVQPDFFLNRHQGRDRALPPIGYIALPIIGTLSLCCAVMVAIFQREDPIRKQQSAGGLDGKATAAPIGKSYNRF